MTLTQKILEAAAFTHKSYPLSSDVATQEYSDTLNHGAAVENARLLPLLTALASVASAADRMKEMHFRNIDSLSGIEDALERLRAQIGGRDD